MRFVARLLLFVRTNSSSVGGSTGSSGEVCVSKHRALWAAPKIMSSAPPSKIAAVNLSNKISYTTSTRDIISFIALPIVMSNCYWRNYFTRRTSSGLHCLYQKLHDLPGDTLHLIVNSNWVMLETNRQFSIDMIPFHASQRGLAFWSLATSLTYYVCSACH
jgi:hypothetical protein